MFILYQSNSLDVLKHVFLYSFKKNINYDNTIILVPDHNLSLFLKMFLANNLGICANLNFFLPGKFIWKIYRKFLPQLSKDFFLKKHNLMFIIMNILPKLLYFKEFYLLKKYLVNDYNYKKLFNLSCKIADIFDKYLIYRIDWLYKWENYKLVDNLKDDIHQLWQSILWREIVFFYRKKFKFYLNREDIYYKFINLLILNKSILKNYLSELFIFNISYLPPIYLNTIYQLSKYINVHYFIINFSSKYWYDKFNFNKKNINFLKTEFKKSDFFLYKLNPLLLNNGKIFSEYLSLLKEFDLIEIDCFVKFSENSFFNKVKNNILNFKNFLNKNNLNIIKKNKNNSIIINSSSGYINEVIKLKDFLFKLIQNKKYNVCDILVVVSDLDKYYSYINMVFSDPLCKKYLPFHIMQKNFIYDNKILNLFLDLLNISNIKFVFSKVLYFLKNKIFLDKFNISIDEFEIISDFIKKDGICTDINNFFININFNKFDYSNLIYSIKRILLGYAINEKYCCWNNIIPYPTISNNYFYILIGKLSDFVFKIYYWKDILNKKYYLYDWIDICKKFLDIFFLKKTIENNFYLNHYFWFNFLNKYKLFFFKKKIKVDLFIKILNYFLVKKKNKLYSISHINFSSFSTLYGIPFKVICFLGMNDNIYPKNIFYYNFDLINSNPRLGDKNKLDYDKYIFIKFLLSAKKKIYISYLNFSFKKNTKCFPSILLINLMNYLDNNFLFKKKRNKNEFIIINNNLKFKNKKKNFLIKLVKNKYIFLKKIHLFLFNPIKYFMFFYLKISYFMYNYFIDYNNLFNLNIQRFYLFRLDIINFFLKYKKINDEIILCLQSLNLLPFGSLGKILWIKEKEKIFFLIKNISYSIFKISKYNFFIKIYDFNFYGTIFLYKKSSLIKWLPKNLNLIDALLFWIDHLVYCILGGYKSSIIYGYNGIWTFTHVKKKIAEQYLYKYIMYYYYFNIRNIFFLPKCSHVWIYNAYDLNTKNMLNGFLLNKAFNRVKNTLYGDYFNVGEINDIYIYNYIKKFNLKININFVISKSEDWLLNMFSYLHFNI